MLVLLGLIMARVTGKLNPRKVAGALTPGRHGDGGNLYLIVEKSGARRWLFIYRWNGRQREMGLGSLADVPLARAREKAAAARAVLADGQDPLEAKAQKARTPTFGEVADETIASLTPGFANAKHREQWAMTLREYARPLRDKAVDTITTEDVLRVLKPIWTKIPETADRTRQRIERVLDAAEAKGYRSGGLRNPASWKGNLKHLLPARKKLARGHHPAMAFERVAALMADLRLKESLSARALEFTILTASRSGEVIGARWDEFDLPNRVWVVPAERMKAKRPHRVALSARAVEILEHFRPYSGANFVFAFTSEGNPLSNMAMTMLLRGMPEHFMSVGGLRRAATVHGFRSSFRDWAGTCTDYPRELAEEALAHTVGNAVERAYRRNDALERRRKMMEDWADYIGPSGTGEVVEMAA
jgi:integrase